MPRIKPTQFNIFDVPCNLFLILSFRIDLISKTGQKVSLGQRFRFLFLMFVNSYILILSFCFSPPRLCNDCS